MKLFYESWVISLGRNHGGIYHGIVLQRPKLIVARRWIKRFRCVGHVLGLFSNAVSAGILQSFFNTPLAWAALKVSENSLQIS